MADRFFVPFPPPKEANFFAVSRTADETDRWLQKKMAELEIRDRTINLEQVKLLVYGRNTYVCGLDYLSEDHVWLSFRYLQRSPGYIAKQWTCTYLGLKSANNIGITDDMEHAFADRSIVCQRIIILIDDICFERSAKFFQIGDCNYCGRYRHHHTPNCPFFPTESRRAAELKLKHLCVGCGLTCSIGNNDHIKVPGFIGCKYCRDAGYNHVDWRCASKKRKAQWTDRLTSYLTCAYATRQWSDAQWAGLLRKICDAKDLPFPEAILSANIHRIH